MLQRQCAYSTDIVPQGLRHDIQRAYQACKYSMPEFLSCQVASNMAADLEAAKKAVAEQIGRISEDAMVEPSSLLPQNHEADMLKLADAYASANASKKVEENSHMGEDAVEMLARMSSVSSQSLRASSFRNSLPGTSMRSASFRSVGTMQN
jgi:hypothetical protein